RLALRPRPPLAGEPALGAGRARALRGERAGDRVDGHAARQGGGGGGGGDDRRPHRPRLRRSRHQPGQGRARGALRRADPGGEGRGDRPLRDRLHGDPLLRAGPRRARRAPRARGPGAPGRADRRPRGGEMKINAVKGMKDVLPTAEGEWVAFNGRLWERAEAVFREVFRRYAFDEVRTPIVEEAQLFARAVGEATDIVGKEMYTFEARSGGRLLALRPEG